MGRRISRRAFMWGGAGGGLLLAAGCDLLELAQNPVINFKLPPRTYTLKTEDPNWRKPPQEFNQRVSCTTKESCCTVPGTTQEVPGCTMHPVVCQSSACGIDFPLEVANTIDLAKEAPELQNSKAISEITLINLEYKISNGVGVEFPAVKLYIAPAGVKSASSGGEVHFLGESPVAPPGLTMVSRDVPAEAQKAFAAYAKDTKNPFNFIAATRMTILSGTNVMSGQVDIEVTGKISVRFMI